MILTEAIKYCTCGAKPVVIGHQSPESLGWYFYVWCIKCKNTERGSHESTKNAVQAWNSTFK